MVIEMGLKTRRIGIISGLLVLMFILAASASAQPPIPTPPLPPFFDNLNITPAKIERGDNVTISFDIMNTDSQSITRGVTMWIENAAFPPPFWPPYDVTLMIWVDLEAYESKTVSQNITLDQIGEYHVWVEGLTGSFTVGTWPPEPPLTPAELVLSNLSIEPEEVELWGDIDVWNFKITVDVTNVGEQEGMDTINLRVDGSIVDRRTVKLKGGEQVTIMYDVMRGVGSYTVEVDGLTGSFVVLNTLKPDEVELSELEALGRQALIHDDEGRPIVEGEYVLFSVLVKNIGETEGTYIVEFKVDGETIDTYNWTLAAGRGHRAYVYYEALNAGTYQVSVGNLTETFTVRAPLEPAEFEFSNLQITPRVKIGMSVNISVDVTNVGEMMGFCTFELKLNGRVVDSVEIPSFGGEVTATQFFELTRGEGTYEVEVGGLTGSFTVFISEPPFWTRDPWRTIIVIVVIAGIVAIYAWRRRGFENIEHIQSPLV